MDFVRVSEEGTHLTLGAAQKPFYFVGANCYYLMTRAADRGTIGEVLTVLDDLAAAGVTVIRTWAFADGPNQWNALQPAPGQWDEKVFRALDRVIVEASNRGLRLLFNLTNFWPDFGGMGQYVAWSRQAKALSKGGIPYDVSQSNQALDASEFYEDPWCRQAYATFVNAVTQRVNTITGVKYCDDPTIIGWGPANEPQCPLDSGARRGVVAMWAHWAGSLIKRCALKQLVFMDCEGFLGPSSPAQCCWNPYDCAATGCDFAQDCASPAIDVACCHLYPDLWLPNASPAERIRFAEEWLDAHVSLCTTLGKPLILSEFGKKVGGVVPEEREEYMAAVLTKCMKLMSAGRPLAGTVFWMAAAPSYPDYDGFTVYFSGRDVPGLPAAAAVAAGDYTAALIEEHAADVRDLNTNTNNYSSSSGPEGPLESRPREQEGGGEGASTPTGSFGSGVYKGKQSQDTVTAKACCDGCCIN